MVKRNEIHAMKLKLRENLFFELKIQFKNHSIYVVKFPPFPPGMHPDGDGCQHFRDGGSGDGGYIFLAWTGDPGTGIFFLARGLRTLTGMKDTSSIGGFSTFNSTKGQNNATK